jgi:UDP-glucose 4-epimerase
MDLKDKRIMVVGGAGFIGSHLVEALLEAGARVTVVDNEFLGRKENLIGAKPFTTKYYKIDASDINGMRRHFDGQHFDVCYNLAVLPLPHSLKHPADNIFVNVQITTTLCDMEKVGFFDQLIHFSSSEVYGSAQYEPMCEKHPLESSTPYAASKAACDLICLSYWRTFDSNISIIRPFNNYGERQNAGMYAGIIPLTINRLMQGQEAEIYGDGEQTRDYIYVKDTVKAALLLAGRDDLAGQVFNIASGHDVPIRWLIQEIMRLMGINRRITYLPARPGDVRRHIANTFKAKDILGFNHSISMEEGLTRTIWWYCNQTPKTNK